MIEARSTRWDVVVVGGANTDYLARGPELPRSGATVRGDEFQEAPGGKGANQAVAAARLGARVTFVGRVGADARGDALMRRLEAEGVDTRHSVCDDEAATGVAVIQVDRKGEKQILTAPGANLRLGTADVSAATDVLRDTRVLLLQFDPPMDTVLVAAHLAHAAGARIVLDPAPPERVPEELLRLVHVIRPNSGEATALTGIGVDDRATARQAAEHLLERGVDAACVQAGKAGDLLVWRSDGGEPRERWLPRFDVASVDATGAGDAFAAALSVMLAEGNPLDEAARFASAAAALTTTKLGAQAALPRREAVLALLARSA
jgi:ribokinase